MGGWLNHGVARPIGNPETGLVVVRGNSGSGKSTLAHRLQLLRDRRLAVVAQDIVRRQILRVPDVPGNASIGLIDTIVRHCLDGGFDVVVEGILGADKYGQMLTRLAEDHWGRSLFVRYELSFEETLRRHASKATSEFGEVEMRQWWREADGLQGVDELVIGPAPSLDETVERIARVMGW